MFLAVLIWGGAFSALGVVIFGLWLGWESLPTWATSVAMGAAAATVVAARRK